MCREHARPSPGALPRRALNTPVLHSAFPPRLIFSHLRATAQDCHGSDDVALIATGAHWSASGGWAVSSSCQSCFEDATGDDAATEACYACRPPTEGCGCTSAELGTIAGDPSGVSAGCWSCAAAAGDNTISVCLRVELEEKSSAAGMIAPGLVLAVSSNAILATL